MLRRCKADWIVCSTMDIIAPKKEYLTNFLSTADKNTFYSVSRRDVEYSELENIGFDNWKSFRDKMDIESEPRYFPAQVTPNDRYSLINCCGDFQLAHKDVWEKIKGFEEEMIYSCFNDTNIQKKAVLNGCNLTAHFDLPLYHLSHTGMGNDGSSPSKQHYNNPWDWVEYFSESKNNDDWGLNNVEIEFEII
jgi:GT2 family glycosyltransferase